MAVWDFNWKSYNNCYLIEQEDGITLIDCGKKEHSIYLVQALESHRPSKALFTGNFLCFFGDPLSKDGLVSKGKDLRNEWLEFLRNGGVAKEELNGFMEGLKKMNDFDADVMCTGHGGVLVGD